MMTVLLVFLAVCAVVVVIGGPVLGVIFLVVSWREAGRMARGGKPSPDLTV